VLNVVATGSSVAEARTRAYAGAAAIHWDGINYRKDIGQA
jgi:phosphoribosylamine---glycine ligase